MCRSYHSFTLTCIHFGFTLAHIGCFPLELNIYRGCYLQQYLQSFPALHHLQTFSSPTSILPLKTRLRRWSGSGPRTDPDAQPQLLPASAAWQRACWQLVATVGFSTGINPLYIRTGAAKLAAGRQRKNIQLQEGYSPARVDGGNTSFSDLHLFEVQCVSQSRPKAKCRDLLYS